MRHCRPVPQGQKPGTPIGRDAVHDAGDDDRPWAGFGWYRDLWGSQGRDAKITVQSATPAKDFAGLQAELEEALGQTIAVEIKSSHAVITLPKDKLDDARSALGEIRPDIRVMSSGDSIEIYKETGLPRDVVARFGVADMSGTHGIGHTRMATESAVTTLGAHPFSTGSDQCLVHNGSLSNHNNLRRSLKHQGMRFETENDSKSRPPI